LLVNRSTYTVGACVAFDTVERLILRACSLTLDLASTIENALPVATVDLHRTAAADFVEDGTRIDLDTGSAMVCVGVGGRAKQRKRKV